MDYEANDTGSETISEYERARCFRANSRRSLKCAFQLIHCYPLDSSRPRLILSFSAQFLTHPSIKPRAGKARRSAPRIVYTARADNKT